MATIAQLAATQADLPTECVASAYDGLALPLWQPDRDKPVLPAEAFAAPPDESAPTWLGAPAAAAVAPSPAPLEASEEDAEEAESGRPPRRTVASPRVRPTQDGVEAELQPPSPPRAGMFAAMAEDD